jgi:hypothetical protein
VSPEPVLKSVNPHVIVDAQEEQQAACRLADLAGNQLGFDKSPLSQHISCRD